METRSDKICMWASGVGLFVTCAVLVGALVLQFFYNEAPCPLCELQRAGLIGIVIALCMNFKYGNRVAHWALVILSSLAGIAVSIRQILLHITDPVGFGVPTWGLHLYTWSFIAFAIAITGAALMLLIYADKR